MSCGEKWGKTAERAGGAALPARPAPPPPQELRRAGERAGEGPGLGRGRAAGPDRKRRRHRLTPKWRRASPWRRRAVAGGRGRGYDWLVLRKGAWFVTSPIIPAFRWRTLIGWSPQRGTENASLYGHGIPGAPRDWPLCPEPLVCSGSSRPPRLRQRSGKSSAFYGSGPGVSGGSRGSFGGTPGVFWRVRGGSVSPESPQCPPLCPATAVLGARLA